MKPATFQFKSFKNDFEQFEIFSTLTVEAVDDIGHFEEVNVLVGQYDGNYGPLTIFVGRLALIREEIESNLKLDLDIATIITYLSELKEFYLEADSKIEESASGNLVCKDFKLKEIPKEIYSTEFYPSYQGFLKELKTSIRKEIHYITQIVNQIDGKSEVIETPISVTINENDLTWNRNINDLVELVKALKLSGAINNSSNNLTLDEAYKFFGNLFGIEIKRPEDQLRQKAESMKKLFFLEELNEVFQKDMKELMKRRMQ